MRTNPEITDKSADKSLSCAHTVDSIFAQVHLRLYLNEGPSKARAEQVSRGVVVVVSGRPPLPTNQSGVRARETT